MPSLRDLTEPVDLAFVMTPLEAVESVLDDAGAAGVKGAVVLASGYREVGADGYALQEQLTAKAAGHGITVLGPNCLGFLNAHARTAPFALYFTPPLQAGPVGVALQSGALAVGVHGVRAGARDRRVHADLARQRGDDRRHRRDRLPDRRRAAPR